MKLRLCFHFILTLFVFLFVECSENSEKVKVVKFTKDSFPISTNLKSKDLNFKKPINPMLFKLLNDSLLLCCNWIAEPYYMEIYELKTSQLIIKFARRGRGPGEYLSAYCTIKNNLHNKFSIFDIHRRFATFYQLDSLLMNKEDYKPEIVSIPPFIGNDIERLNADEFLVFNKYYVSDTRYNNNIESCLFKFSKNKIVNYRSIIESYKFFNHNVTDGFIAVSPSTDRIIVFYQMENRIEIFNKKLELIKILLGPENLRPEYLNDGNNQMRLMDKMSTYWKCFYNNDHVFVIYKGTHSEEPVKSWEIFKFNWNGELLHRYILDKNLYTLYVNEDETKFIGTEYIPSEYPNLIQFDINQ